MKQIMIDMLKGVGYFVAGTAWWLAATITTLAFTLSLLELFGVG